MKTVEGRLSSTQSLYYDNLKGEGADAGIQWIKARDAAKCPKCTRRPPQQRIKRPQMSVGPRLGHLNLTKASLLAIQWEMLTLTLRGIDLSLWPSKPNLFWEERAQPLQNSLLPSVDALSGRLAVRPQAVHSRLPPPQTPSLSGAVCVHTCRPSGCFSVI